MTETPRRPATARPPAGSVVSGWPYERVGSISYSTCSTPGDSYVPHAFAPDGTVYVAAQPAGNVERGEIIALDRHGRLVDDWPYPLPNGAWVSEIELDAGGRVLVTASQGLCTEPTSVRILTPAGEPVP